MLAALAFAACEIRNDDTAPIFVPTLLFSAEIATAPNTLFNRSKTFTFTVENIAVNSGSISLAGIIGIMDLRATVGCAPKRRTETPDKVHPMSGSV